MYKFPSRQIKLSDFKQPVGMNLKADNRWVKKAEIIPWAEIEKRYAELFKNRNGNVAKPLRLALGACLIQSEYGFSDVEVVNMIQEHPYLQFFCGYSGYDDMKKPFDPSLMVYFRKRLTPEILGEINELIIRKTEEAEAKRAAEEAKNTETAAESAAEVAAKNNDNDDGNPPASNSGTLIVDATCAPSQIKYPQDTELLNEARKNTEAMIDNLHKPEDGIKPRTYRKLARKNHLAVVRKRKKNKKEIRKAIKKQLSYLTRNLKTIDTYLENGRKLPKKQAERLETIKLLYSQQKFMYDNNTHSIENRIVSLSQPFLRPIVRGKAKAPVEFGAKLDISVVNGFARLENQSFDAYNEALTLIEIIERYKKRYGKYPERVLADKIYRNRDNLKWCKERNIRLSGPALGRPKKDEAADKKLDYADICDRVEVERSFSLAKRKCGLGQIFTKLETTTKHSIALAILALNLRKVFCAFFEFLLAFFSLVLPQRKFWVVQ